MINNTDSIMQQIEAYEPAYLYTLMPSYALNRIPLSFEQRMKNLIEGMRLREELSHKK
jgi:hypothetical protein